jgi:uncharacterized membrane protein
VAIVIALVPACSTSEPDSLALRAFGNEPFWNVTIDDSLVYGRLGEADISFPNAASDYVEGDSVVVLGPLRDRTGEHEIEIRISFVDCQDTMADMVHPMRARVIIDGEELSGCARMLDSKAPGERP